jgi:hypothetical protein
MNRPDEEGKEAASLIPEKKINTRRRKMKGDRGERRGPPFSRLSLDFSDAAPLLFVGEADR